jgi:hypothetical protein
LVSGHAREDHLSKYRLVRTDAAPSSHPGSIYPKSKTINLLNIHSRKCLERGPGIGYVERIIGPCTPLLRKSPGSELVSHSEAESWLIFYGDVHVSQIRKVEGFSPQWEWRCGFYPGSEPGEYRSGTADQFDQARSYFEAAWRVFWRTAPRLTSRHGATIGTGHARKYAMWERGEKLPTQKPNSTMRCPCGELFDSHRLEHTVLHVPHITEHHREMRRRPSLR